MDLLPLWDETRVPVGQSHGSKQWLANVGDTVQVTTLAALYDRNFLQLNKGIRTFYRFSLSYPKGWAQKFRLQSESVGRHA